MNKKSQHLSTAVLLLIGLTIPVSVFAFTEYYLNPEEAIKNCRACHDNHRKQVFLKNSNPTTHHLLHNSPIKSATAPNSATDKDGLYDCMTCHSATVTKYGPDITAERDCIKCHNSTVYWPDRHHARINSLQDSGAIPNNSLACFLCHDFEVNESGEFTGRVKFYTK